MKMLIGTTMCIIGVVLGVYVGVWLCLIGGIVQAVEAIKTTPVDAWGIAFGIARFLLSSLCGIVSAMILIVPGMAIASSNKV